MRPLHAGEDGATPGLPPVHWSEGASERMGLNLAKTRSVARHLHLTGDGPEAGGHVLGDRHHDVVGMLPPRREVAETFAQAHLGCPADRLDGLWSWFHPPLERAADLGRITRSPGPLEEGPAGERVAGCGDAALAAAFATGVCTGSKSQMAHERSGVLETGQVAECGDEGDGHGELDATHRLEGLDDGGETPALDLLSESSLKALESFVVFSHGPDIRLEDDRLGGRGTDRVRQPAPRGRPPRGTALIPDILAQEEGLQPVLGGLAIPDRILTRAGEVADGFVLDRRDRDRGQIAGTPQPGELGGVTAIGLDAVARLLWDP